MDRKKAYMYTRVSTAMQVDGYSLDAQEEEIRRYHIDFSRPKEKSVESICCLVRE